MGWEIGYDSNWHRDIGYGVPAYCDHPKCRRVIDRGLSFVCSGEPYGGDAGCGLYFCERHHAFGNQLCERCARGQKPFIPKREHPTWLKFKAKDPSWAKWRESEAARKLIA